MILSKQRVHTEASRAVCMYLQGIVQVTTLPEAYVAVAEVGACAYSSMAKTYGFYI